MSLTLRSVRRGCSRSLRIGSCMVQVCLVMAAVAGGAHAHAPRDEELARLDALLREQPQDGELRLRRAGLRIEAGFLDGAASDLCWAGLNDPGGRLRQELTALVRCCRRNEKLGKQLAQVRG